MDSTDPTLTIAPWENDCEMYLERLSFYEADEYCGSTLHMVLADTERDTEIASDTWYDLEKST